MERTLVIFTDLDGTLLDHETYSWEVARPALNLIREKTVPLVLCSSKTRAELEPLRETMGHRHPFIVENGGAVLIPPNYFTAPLPTRKIMDDYHVIELGTPYSVLRNALKEIARETRILIQGYGDLTVEEIALLTNLTFEEAERARAREYDEPFVIEGTPIQQQAVLDSITAKGFQWTRGGRFYHLTGKHDKGQTVMILSDLYRQQYGPIFTVGIGDSHNDLPMLSVVDLPILVQRKDGSYDGSVRLTNIKEANGIGPAGWNKAVLELL